MDESDDAFSRWPDCLREARAIAQRSGFEVFHITPGDGETVDNAQEALEYLRLMMHGGLLVKTPPVPELDPPEFELIFDRLEISHLRRRSFLRKSLTVCGKKSLSAAQLQHGTDAVVVALPTAC